MNEKIKQLADQARVLADEFQEQWKAGPSNEEFFQEKFAQLIVRECIDWCNAHARDDGTAQRIAEDIKKDFRVEE